MGWVIYFIISSFGLYPYVALYIFLDVVLRFAMIMVSVLFIVYYWGIKVLRK
ncbi:hypothetical protein FD44_GL001048 [Secundilactobacillus malefermentans DSM 5705 = KCTC 3548]|nr:hypothetical protein FD44_GL001048 [Secundilactobacillus malefermentans DSM 5705 = KCTC 3548]